MPVFADWWGWEFTFVLAGALMAGAFLMNWVWYPRDSGERVRDLVIFARYWSLLSMNFFHVATVAIVTQRVAYWGMLSFFAAFLIQAYDLSLGFVAVPLVISAIGQVIGSYGARSYGAGFVATRRYRVLLIALTTATGGVCGFLFFAVDFGLWPAVALGTAGLGLLSVMAPVVVASSTEYSGESKATGASLIGFGNQAGGVVGAGVSGALLASMGYGGIGYLCLAFTIGSALLVSVFAMQLRVNTG